MIASAVGTATFYLEDPEVGPEETFFLNAIFDEDACTLSGVYVYPRINGTDIFVWDMAADPPSGDYAGGRDNNYDLFENFGRQEVTYLG